MPGARRLSSSPARRLALPYQAEPLGARSAGPPGEYVRSLAPRAPTPSAPVALPIERKSRGMLPGPWAGLLCTFPPTGCPVPLLAAPANVPQVGNQTLQPPASPKEAQTDVAGTLGPLGASPGLMIVQEVAIKGAWEAGWRREQKKSNSADLGTVRVASRSCGQRLCVLAGRACSFLPWQPRAMAIIAL